MGKMIDLQLESGKSQAYLAIPPSGKGPGLLLMHPWWGLTIYFQKMADRLASQGFVVLAPDLYNGRSAGTIPDAERLIGKLDSQEAIKKEIAALDELLTNPAVTSKKIGAIGFSMGGSYATWLATLRPEIVAVVLFYGGSEQEEGYAEKTQAAFLGHFAEGDEWEPEEAARQLEAQLKAAGRDATFHFYHGVGHWFVEGNRPDVYDPEAARLAWDRTMDFLHKHLG